MRWIQALATVCVAFSAFGCAASLEPRETAVYSMNEDQLQQVTESIIDNGRWIKLRAEAPRETRATIQQDSGQKTELVITYQSAGEGKSKALFEGKSSATLNWLMLGIPGLAGKPEAVRSIDILMDEINVKATGK